MLLDHPTPTPALAITTASFISKMREYHRGDNGWLMAEHRPRNHGYFILQQPGNTVKYCSNCSMFFELP